MRLSAAEIAAIKDCAARHLGRDATVRLFGSRVNDAARGGDIDLHVTIRGSDLPSLEAECDFVDALVGQIGEQRIDLVVHPDGRSMRPIDHVAINEGIVL